MKRIAFLLILILGAFWFLSQKAPILKAQLASQNSSKKSQTSESQVSKNLNSSSPLSLKLREESLKIGKVDGDPEETEKKLQAWARSLSSDDLKELALQAISLDVPQDTRFLAVMLLGWSEKFEALSHLTDIALAEIDPFLSPNRSGDFERILRMQAVDGILKLPISAQDSERSLSSIAARSGQSSLVDRAHRALWALRGQALQPSEQDQEALGKVLQEPSR
jgi:hypothetical protein